MLGGWPAHGKAALVTGQAFAAPQCLPQGVWLPGLAGVPHTGPGGQVARPGALGAGRKPHSAMLKQCLAAALVRVIPERIVQFSVCLRGQRRAECWRPTAGTPGGPQPRHTSRRRHHQLGTTTTSTATTGPQTDQPGAL